MKSKYLSEVQQGKDLIQMKGVSSIQWPSPLHKSFGNYLLFKNALL